MLYFRSITIRKNFYLEKLVVFSIEIQRLEANMGKYTLPRNSIFIFYVYLPSFTIALDKLRIKVYLQSYCKSIIKTMVFLLTESKIKIFCYNDATEYFILHPCSTNKKLCTHKSEFA